MNRKCGSCTLCCRLLPVHDNWVIPAMHKGAGERCRHQFSGGCRVYHGLNFPACCDIWTCRWLSDPATAHLNRPDRSHYVIDTYTDKITIEKNDTGEKVKLRALQIWIDPAYPDAWKDPALLDYARELGLPLLIRLNSRDAHIVMDPEHLPEGFRAHAEKGGFATCT